MKANVISAILTLALLATTSLGAGPETNDVKTVVITASDTMKFSVTAIEVQPGQTVHVQLRNQGTIPKDVMGHNWILLKTGADVATYANSAVAARKENYQPKTLDGEVLASIPLIGPRQSAEVTFEAPSTPGAYPYLCSFPGHFQAGMRGVLIVK